MAQLCKSAVYTYVVVFMAALVSTTAAAQLDAAPVLEAALEAALVAALQVGVGAEGERR